MATSGSYDYSTSAAAIIKDALIEIGAIAEGETVNSGDEALGLRHLNRMVKHWQVSGYNLWTRERGTLTLAAAKGTDANPYLFGTGGDFTTHRPLRIESMRFVDSNGYERPMIQVSRQEYDDLPEKDSTGEATLFHYDPQIGSGKLYVWPVLSSTGSGTLAFTYQRPIEDFDATSNEPDFPQEWYETLVYGLAARLAPHFFPQDMGMQQRLMQTASMKLNECLAFDKEPASSFFLVSRKTRRV
jgi:hypothetical protein